VDISHTNLRTSVVVLESRLRYYRYKRWPCWPVSDQRMDSWRQPSCSRLTLSYSVWDLSYWR